MGLDLKGIADNAAKTAFNVAGNAIENVTYIQRTTDDYDPDTGVTETETEIDARMLVEGMALRELQGFNHALEISDNTGVFKATVIATELGVVPKSNDIVVRNSISYIVVGVKPGDPTTAIYELAIKEPD